MNQHEKQLRERLHHADPETVERLAEQFPAAEDAAKERIYQNILKGQSVSSDAVTEEVSIVRHSRYRSIGAAAACLLLCGSLVGTAAFQHMSMTSQDPDAEHSSDTTLETEERSATAQLIERENAWMPKEYTIKLPETEIAIEVMEQPEITSEEHEQIPVETEELPAVVETDAVSTNMPAQAETTTEPTETPETQPVGEETQPAATETQPSVTQSGLTFISMAESLPAIPGFMVTSLDSEWGKKCAIKPTECERKGDIQTRYRASYLPAGWVRDTEAGTNDANFERMTALGHRWYNYDTYYAMEAGGSPQTTSYLIVAQSVHDSELMCRQDYVIGNSGMEVPEDPSCYAYAVTNVGEHPAFIYRESHPNGDGTCSIWYTLYWEQDGYICSVYLADVPESYLSELVKIAGSVQPIE